MVGKLILKHTHNAHAQTHTHTQLWREMSSVRKLSLLADTKWFIHAVDFQKSSKQECQRAPVELFSPIPLQVITETVVASKQGLPLQYSSSLSQIDTTMRVHCVYVCVFSPNRLTMCNELSRLHRGPGISNLLSFPTDLAHPTPT